jgi:hypothetical protein
VHNRTSHLNHTRLAYYGFLNFNRSTTLLLPFLGYGEFCLASSEHVIFGGSRILHTPKINAECGYDTLPIIPLDKSRKAI